MGYRTLFTLPENVDSEKLKRIIDNLNRKQFKVIEVEDLQAE
nr:hypothetical protein [Lactiplantibacillus plantarum]